MLIFAMICFLVGGLFLSTLRHGAPYIPTKRSEVDKAIALLGLESGQVLVELGSGDGRVLRAAAKQGIRAIGYELNPILVLYSRLRNWRHRQLIEIRRENYWKSKLPACDAIYIFLMKPYMKRLEQKITKEINQAIKVLSFEFSFDGRQPIDRSDELFVYAFSPEYPSRQKTSD